MQSARTVRSVFGIAVGLVSLGVANAQMINTVAGGGPNNLPALSANLSSPADVAADDGGNLFIVSFNQNRVFKVDGSGQLTVAAGNGSAGFSGDGGAATSASLGSAHGVVQDADGNLFITSNNSVRRVDVVTGIITTIAGNGIQGYSGDGGLATSASMRDPAGVALDADGNLFIADYGNQRIRRVDNAIGIITTVAGNGAVGCFPEFSYYCFGGDGGPATDANIGAPRGVALDAAGNLFIADWGNDRVRRVDAATGIITTVAGSGEPGYSGGFSGDGGLATSAKLLHPTGVELDADDNLFIADWGNNRVRRVDNATGIITTVAGNGSHGFSGDGGLATSASLFNPTSVAVDAGGNLFIADSTNGRIRRVDGTTRIITTVAGNGTLYFSGDGGLAVDASMADPTRVASDVDGNLFISIWSDNRIRRVDAATGIITTVAGNGIQGFSGDGGPATSASLQIPYGVALDADRNLFIADRDNGRVRRVDAATGIITTVAGNAIQGFSGDGGPATSASLRIPRGVALDANRNLFIADYRRIRRVDAVTGIITTVAGNGTCCFSGDGGLATSARIAGLAGIALDADGNLFIADMDNHRIRRVDASTGIITTVAGDGNAGFSGDGGPATNATLKYPEDIALDADRNLFIADRNNGRVRRVDSTTGIITTIAGNGIWGFSGDGGLATDASMAAPSGVALDADNHLFIADSANKRIRQVSDDVTRIDIDVDIKPDSTPNSINPTNEGVISVAILGSESFEVSEVDGTTLIFGKDEAKPAHDLADPASFAKHLEDVNRDGFTDLVSHYRTEEAGIMFGDVTACLSGKTLDDVPFKDCDAVRTIPDKDGDGLLDLEEENIGTNAFFKDSDGDGYDDGVEVLTLETDPLNPLDPPPAPAQEPARRGKRRR